LYFLQPKQPQCEKDIRKVHPTQPQLETPLKRHPLKGLLFNTCKSGNPKCELYKT
jgi:hypothetical protein